MGSVSMSGSAPKKDKSVDEFGPMLAAEEDVEVEANNDARVEAGALIVT